MRKSVSVCMAAYNGEKYIEEQIYSILPQLTENDEIIISDDGSTDRTLEIIENINDKRITVVKGQKKGFACNFFNAIAHANNEIIFLCDQDDIWADNKIVKVLSVFDSNPKCTTVTHEMYTFHNDINEKGNEFPRKYRKGFNYNVLFSSYWGCCMAFKKEFIDKVLPVNEPRLAHDQLIGLASERNGKTVAIPDKLLYHRMHDDNRTSTKNSLIDMIKFRFQIFSEYEEFEDTYYKNTEEKCPEFINKLATPAMEKISQILILIFIADCCIFGGGRLLDFGYLSFRILVFGLAFICSLPFVLKNLKRMLRNPFVYLTMMYGVAVVIWSVIGYLYANPLSFIRSDITRYLSFALLPGMLIIFNTKKKFMSLIDVVFYSSVLLAFAALFIQMLLPNQPVQTFYKIHNFVNVYQLGGLTKLQSGSYRVYFRSGIYTQVAIMLGIWKMWSADNLKKKVFISVCMGILVFAWIISYTRGYWFGLAVSVLFVLVWQPNIFGKCFQVAMCALLACAVLIGVSAINEGQPTVAMELYNRVALTAQQAGGNSSESDYIDYDYEAMVMRIKTKQMHWEYIKLSPVFGRGLGAYLVGLRDASTTEYSYLDAFMKFGLVGFPFFLMAYFVFVPRFVVHRIYQPKENVTKSFYSLVTLIVAAYMGIIATSYSNPFIVSPLGISYLLIVDVAVFYSRKFEKEN